MTVSSLSESEDASCTKEQLLSYMWANDDLFTVIKQKSDRSKTGQYRAGVSFSGLVKMKELAEYLAVLYPKYEQYERIECCEPGDEGISEKLQEKQKGKQPEKQPKIREIPVFHSVKDPSGKIRISQLVLAMTQVKCWNYYEQPDRNDAPAPDFEQMTTEERLNWVTEEYERVRQMSPEERNQWMCGSDALYGNLSNDIKKQISEIPFNKYVVMFCKEFRKRIRKIMNIEDRKVDNVESITRNDVLFLSYMFLSGYMTAMENDCENDRETLKKMADEAENLILQKGTEGLSEEERLKGQVGHSISEIITQMDEIKNDEDEASYKIKACLDQFLKLFDFDELYLPLVFERFVFLCLVREYQDGNDDATYELINTGYMLSVEAFLKNMPDRGSLRSKQPKKGGNNNVQDHDLGR